MSDCVHYEPRPGALSLTGELTLTNVTALKEVLLRALAAHPELELDLLNVSIIDTAGVQLLIMLHREATRLGKRLAWLGYSLAVEEALELLDLAPVLGRPAAVVWS
ncbi:MAG: anti-sigma factor antagonist [Myxococcaceae bacterium]|nr:anti-sigma factor antagonist [Myxococcaceae bacterium]